VRRGLAAALVIVAIASLGFSAGVLYDDGAADGEEGVTSTVTSATATVTGLSGVHEVLGEQQYDAEPRKHAVAKCPDGETVLAGGYILAGSFQTVGTDAPASLPIVTESTPAASDIVASLDAWAVWAIAPSDFVGEWGITPKAICAKVAER
jgi:hypothetical protein